MEIETLVLYPVIIARLHGSWWTDEYTYWYFFFAGVLFFAAWTAAQSEGSPRRALQAMCAAYLAAFLEISYHSAQNGGGENMGFVVVAVFGHLLWAVVAALLFYTTFIHGKLLGVVLVAGSVALLFLFGGGFYFGALFCLLAGVLFVRDHTGDLFQWEKNNNSVFVTNTYSYKNTNSLFKM